jgi:hypothetical protein
MNDEDIDFVVSTLQSYGWNITKKEGLWLEVKGETNA